MNHLLEEIFKTQKFANQKNEVVEIHSETDRGQCALLQKLIVENKFKKSIEIGFAYGTSTLAMVEKVAEYGGEHVVIDPFQNMHWEGNGLDLVDQAGYSSKLRFIEDYSYIALPELLRKGERFDFAYIDTVKIFDYLVVDFFFLDKLLTENGIIVFDDVPFPGIRKLLRFLSQFPHYEVCGQYPENEKIEYSWKFNMLKKYFPKVKSIMSESRLVNDYELGINTNCVALRKLENDKRNWD